MRSALLVVLLLAGCEVGPYQPDPPPAPPEDPPADALEARLRERGEELAAWMMPHGEPMRGEMEADESRDFSHIMNPGWCYKVVAVGGEGVEDLDIRLYDGHSVLVQRDTTHDDEPYIGKARPICPVVSANYRIEVRAAAGSGEFAVQVYRSL